MKCPKCEVDLRTTDFGEYGFVVIDICPKCQGAWFDRGELDRLDDSVWTNVEEIEFKNVVSSRQNIKCPKCDINLEAISPKDAERLIVDRCPVCQGFWLDQGELDNMKDIAIGVDDKIAEEMPVLQRPRDWSALRWAIYCFKECYFKRF